MTRRRVLIAIAVPVVLTLVAGVAWAAFSAKLPGRGTAASPTIAGWDTAIAAVSNDTGVLGDPTEPGFNPARSDHVGVTPTPTFSGKTLVSASTGWYLGYMSSVRATAKSTQAPLRVQRVILSDDLSVGTATRFTPGVELRAKIDPAACGVDLSTATVAARALAANLEHLTAPVDDATNFAYTIEFEVVPAAQYVAATCTSQSW